MILFVRGQGSVVVLHGVYRSPALAHSAVASDAQDPESMAKGTIMERVGTHLSRSGYWSLRTEHKEENKTATPYCLWLRVTHSESGLQIPYTVHG